ARRISGSGARGLDGLTELAGADTGALRAAFGRALAENPKDRFETALGFVEALKDAFPDVAVAPPPATKRPSKSRPAEAVGAPVAASESRLPLEATPIVAAVEPEPPAPAPVEAEVRTMPAPVAPIEIGRAKSSARSPRVARTDEGAGELDLRRTEAAR